MKYIATLGLAGCLLLSACSADADSESSKDSEAVSGQAQESEKKPEEKEVEENSDVDKEEPAEQERVDPLYEINEANWSVSPIGDANSKVVLLTFDDAPDQHAVEMAHKLKELDAKAIFFVNGHFLDTPEEEEKLKEIHDLGFPIGNHTFSHPSLPDLTEEEQREEIVSLNDRVEEIIGEKPVFFRAPFGANTDYSKQVVKDEGMVLMNWTYGYDWEADYQNSASLADIMVNTEYLTNGANLLMHDRTWTNEALPAIVSGLRDKGYDLVDPLTIKGVSE
ncbi:polysaccharide deacetylase family protein [Jeotgalibacillus sp. S-D1]|uniref:polysaccharide deacetylase family protein n=1 Tax=Jeotgalibacillus sp. S-D1 TaxID=2552189 RepID=UPI0010595DD8|nr:polysaccharide deacetylase family protein [Jeotgalibacillus sp. S-D1]TDL35186.1 polysaccharide deacetylase family protein [Jeotgalibacillus sp. S-D1]